MNDTMKVIDSLTQNGFKITRVNHLVPLVLAVGNNEDEEVTVVLRRDGLCAVTIDDTFITNLALPYLTGECARLRKHVGVFE